MAVGGAAGVWLAGEVGQRAVRVKVEKSVGFVGLGWELSDWRERASPAPRCCRIEGLGPTVARQNFEW